MTSLTTGKAWAVRCLAVLVAATVLAIGVTHPAAAVQNGPDPTFQSTTINGTSTATTYEPTDAADQANARGSPEQRMPGAHHSFSVWRGGHASIPDHTIYRPAELQAVHYKLPIVVWANGGCRHSNMEYHYFLTTFASYGVFIVANGAPENPYEPTDLTPLLSPQPEMLIQGIDWALQENGDRTSPYFGQLDPQRILVMGQSCGGYEAIDASADPRVRSTIIWNSGANPDHPMSVRDLHSPVLFAEGGTFDHWRWDAIVGYQLAEVPAVHATGAKGGHTAWWDDQSTPPPSEQQKEPLPVAAQWLAFTLYGSEDGRTYFLGENCGLCGQQGWTVESKNWD